MRFEALENFYYNGRKWKRGEQFDALSEKDAVTLRMCWKDVKQVNGPAKPMTTEENPAVVPTQKLETTDMKAEEPKPQTDPLTQRRRRYPHRAMRAEE